VIDVTADREQHRAALKEAMGNFIATCSATLSDGNADGVVTDAEASAWMSSTHRRQQVQPATLIRIHCQESP
jgi:sugar lactone lactonase YvrE